MAEKNGNKKTFSERFSRVTGVAKSAYEYADEKARAAEKSEEYKRMRGIGEAVEGAKGFGTAKTILSRHLTPAKLHAIPNVKAVKRMDIRKVEDVKRKWYASR